MKLQVILISLVVGLSLCLFFSIKSCTKSKTEYNQTVVALTNYQDTVFHQKIKLKDFNDSVVSISYNNSIIISEKQQLSDLLNIKDKQLLDMTKQFKQITTAASINTNFNYPDAVIIYDTIKNNKFDSIVFKHTDKYFSFNGSITNTTLSLRSVDIPNTQKLIFGEKNNGIFHANTKIISILNSNPYIITT